MKRTVIGAAVAAIATLGVGGSVGADKPPHYLPPSWQCGGPFEAALVDTVRHGRNVTLDGDPYRITEIRTYGQIGDPEPFPLVHRYGKPTQADFPCQYYDEKAGTFYIVYVVAG